MVRLGNLGWILLARLQDGSSNLGMLRQGKELGKGAIPLMVELVKRQFPKRRG